MRLKPKNYEDKLKRLKKLSHELNKRIEDGSFYDLSFLARYFEIRKIKKIYNSLLGPVSETSLKQAVSYAAIFMLISGSSCKNMENDLATVNIDLGLKDKAMISKAAPTDLAKMTLKVTGQGMDDIVLPLTLDAKSVTLEVPAGSARRFAVKADRDNTSAFYCGDAVKDLSAGDIVNITINMEECGFIFKGSNPFGITNSSYPAYITFTDIDDDGDQDLFITDNYDPNDGVTTFFENQSENAPNNFGGTATPNPFGLGNIFNNKEFVDIDGDGDLDVFAFGYYMFDYNYSYAYVNNAIMQYTNTDPQTNGIANQPNFSGTLNPALPIPFPFSPYNPRLSNFNYPTISFADIDADGDYDAIIGGVEGLTSQNPQFLINKGDSKNPSFNNPVENFGGLEQINISSSYQVVPVFVDLDSDGDFDLFIAIGKYSSTVGFRYYENTGNSKNPSFASAKVDPFGLYYIFSARGYPAFADIDNDGDLDLFVGDINGYIQYYENNKATFKF